jgi:hypothetical protein
MPPTDPSPAEPNHPFETDIDVTEKGLCRLLDTAVMKEGSQRLDPGC